MAFLYDDSLSALPSSSFPGPQRPATVLYCAHCRQTSFVQVPVRSSPSVHVCMTADCFEVGKQIAQESLNS